MQQLDLEFATHLLAGYRPPAGVQDELMDSMGEVRPVWRDFAHFLGRLTPEDTGLRFARGDQYLRDSGVYFRRYGQNGADAREWPLSHIPVLLSDKEWTGLGAALAQRSELLEAVVADLYGDNRMIAEGWLPPSLVAANPEWLRPMVGVKPRSGHFLHMLAFEIGRGPDGRWWVMGDRAQAPSGAGFALENRVATRRVFSDFFAHANIHRLAGFFTQFQNMLSAHTNGDGQAAILSPGPFTDTYYEHVYLARYLSLMLLEGEDLAVVDGRVMVRTVEGLRPVDVLWRRLDSAYADPLELNEQSQLGTPGLAGAIRRGTVSMVNALGSGVLEMNALQAFLPRICENLRGEPLLMPNVATWWCGEKNARQHVLANLDRMMIGPALSNRLPFEISSENNAGYERPPHLAHDAWLEAHGEKLVAQELVTLSTTPAFQNGQLTPRPLVLRVFAVRTRRGWRMMPGGFARVGRSESPSAIAMQNGGAVADVWVVSENSVDTQTSLMEPSDSTPRQRETVLTSRSADNLFWLGRYSVRAEGMLRLLRCYHTRLGEISDSEAPLLNYISSQLARYGVGPGVQPVGLINGINAALGCAAKVREQFSIDGWAALSDIATNTRELLSTREPGYETARALGELLQKTATFSGLVQENMFRSPGWRFLNIGRQLERAMLMCVSLSYFAEANAPQGAFDVVLELGDSVLTHRRRFSLEARRNTVIGVLALEQNNPQSIHFLIDEIYDHLRRLPGADTQGQLTPPAFAAKQARSEIAAYKADTLDSKALSRLHDQLAEISSLIDSAYFR
ncbi:MAG: circularly permuted type 2 ATP-grasp protein [Caulobacterales bacterium]